MSASGRPASHEIRVEGILDGRWAAWSGGLQVQGAGAQTVISGLLAGQPGLHGLLDKIGDLGLCLIPCSGWTPMNRDWRRCRYRRFRITP